MSLTLSVGVWISLGGDTTDAARASTAAPAPATLPATTTTRPTTTTASTTTTTAVPVTTVPPTTAPPPTAPPTTAPPPTEAAVADTSAPPVTIGGPLPAPGTWTLEPYQGLGTWVDVYDWSATYTNGNPGVGLAEIDHMAAVGVRTLFIQTARQDSPGDVLEPERLVPLLQRARADGIRVVAWFLPDLSDVQADLAHFAAAARLPIDGLAVDIESRSVEDVDQRNANLIALSQSLRSSFPGQVLGGIVLPPVIMEDVNPNYWPGFPWAGIAPSYDVWLPMSYFTFRTGSWRSAYQYTAVDVQRVRDHIGQPDAPVHTIGGIGDLMTADDAAQMRQAAVDTGCLGLSVYDFRTTADELYPYLR